MDAVLKEVTDWICVKNTCPTCPLKPNGKHKCLAVKAKQDLASESELMLIGEAFVDSCPDRVSKLPSRIKEKLYIGETATITVTENDMIELFSEA